MKFLSHGYRFLSNFVFLALVYYSIAENDRSKLQLAELVCKQGKEHNDKYAPLFNTNGLISDTEAGSRSDTRRFRIPGSRSRYRAVSNASTNLRESLRAERCRLRESGP